MSKVPQGIHPIPHKQREFLVILFSKLIPCLNKKPTVSRYPTQNVPRISPHRNFSITSSQEFIFENKIKHCLQRLDKIGVETVSLL